MSSFRLMPLVRPASLINVACVAAMLTAGAAFAQPNSSQSASNSPTPMSTLTETSSQTTPNFAAGDWSSSLASSQVAESRAPEFSFALPSAPAPSASAAGQGSNGTGGGGGIMSRLAFEGGFGFNTAQSSSITTGWNLQVGGGLQLTPSFMVPIEYQFIRTGLPQTLITEAGAQGGNAHIWSFTVDPTFDFFPKASNDLYVKGGGGFYRKLTSFTDPTESYYCSYFYGCYPTEVNQVVGHFSSNQGGFNIGGGYYHRFGGMYGTGKMKFFAEARYLDVLTPAITGESPTTGGAVTSVPADTKLFPVTFGFSW